MPLMSGERQVAPTTAGIRGDHRARYHFAAARLASERVAVLDAGCGIGYGARVLADAGLPVHAWDVDDEAIAYGREHYDHQGLRWAIADICASRCHVAEVAVAFEVLEHLERPGLALIRFPDRLIASVPNGSVVPKEPGTFPHHVRHYTPAEFDLLLMGAGYRVAEWWSQRDTGGSPLVRGSNGRTLIAVCER